MPRKNIFSSKKLKLDCIEDEFYLTRNGNTSGTIYDAKGAYNLLMTIFKEQEKQTHVMDFQLQNFEVSTQALVLIEDYCYENSKKLPKLESIPDN